MLRLVLDSSQWWNRVYYETPEVSVFFFPEDGAFSFVVSFLYSQYNILLVYI